MKDLAILIPSWSGPKLLDTCLLGIKRNCETNYDIIVILNEVDEDSYVIAKKWGVKIITISENIGTMAVDMETATLFTCGFANQIPTGALLLVSDQPMISDGVKTEKSDNIVTKNFVEEHVIVGIESLMTLINNGETVKHLRFETW